MKKIISAGVFLLLIIVQVNAQFEQKSIKNPKAEMREDISDVLKTEFLHNTNHNIQENDTKYRINANIGFDYQKPDHFVVLKKSTQDHFIWMRGTVDQNKAAPISSRSMEWIEIANKTLELAGEGTEWTITKVWTDQLGEEHVRLEQMYVGVPVYGAEIILHTDHGQLKMMNGKLVPDEVFSSNRTAQLTLESAETLVKNDLSSYRENAFDFNGLDLPVDVKQVDTRLVYYPKSEGEYDLTYHVKIYANAAERYEYIVDAVNGEIIEHFSTICNMTHTHGSTCEHNHNVESNNSAVTNSNADDNSIMDGPVVGDALDLAGISRELNTYQISNTYFMIDASREMFNTSSSTLPDDPRGAIWTIDLNNTSPVNDNSLYTHIVSGDNKWSTSPEGVSAHYNAGMAYDYFRNTFNRNAITGTGQSIISFINVTDPDENSLGNAFWNGIGIYYGNGDDLFESLGRGLDVAGHEMSHGVIESTANLEYRNESGAMNEAFADIFGAMIDRDDWQIGEEVVKTSAFPSGALRDMSDPHNGAATGDFQRGWQPSHYDERYIGGEDNGGVHINSGIINNAFYRLAQKQNRSVAEQVFYRALTTYLTRSSDFDELRFAAVQSAQDLYGSAAANDVREAFNEVGITDESEMEEVVEYEVNPGSDLLLVSDQDLEGLYLFDLQTGQAIFNPFTQTPVLSKPSITDDGSRILYVGQDNHVHVIDIDWSVSPPAYADNIITNYPEWRNAVISKDGRFIALLENVVSNRIIAIDLLNGDGNEFFLYNPTYSSGITTGEVQFADVLEFDHTSGSIMYDAFNEVQGSSGTLQFWDIGFIEIWNHEFDTWALGDIQKLFTNIPEGLNIANPTFSKNSPNIIALDIFDGFDFEILGVDLETQEIGSIIPTAGLSYPSFSNDDRFLVFDLELLGYSDLGILELNDDKISRVINSDQIILTSARWGNWFGNGTRILSSNESVLIDDSGFVVYPNPTSDEIQIKLDLDLSKNNNTKLTVFNSKGQRIWSQSTRNLANNILKINVADWAEGTYYISIQTEAKQYVRSFVKSGF